MTTGSVLAQFTITLSQAVSEQVAVEWHTADGTAQAGVDYAAAKGTVLFAPGQTAKTVDILVHGRAVGSEDRSFFVEMLPPTNAILGASIGECIIHVDTTGSTPVTQIIVPTGPQGLQGDSAYQTWLYLGNTGTEVDFINSLKPSAEEIAEEVAPILNVGNSPLTAEGTETLSNPDTMTGKRLARRVAYVGAAKVATVVLADGDNLITHAALSGDAVDFNSISLYPRILRGTVAISPEWSVEPGDKLLIKSAVAGDFLHVCQYDITSEWAVRNALAPVGSQAFEALRRSYAEVGCNVAGTFRKGFTIVNENDIGIDEVTGKGFTGPVGTVAAGTNPASGGFVDRSNLKSWTFNTISEATSINRMSIGQRVRWLGYHSLSDGGGNWGIVRSGAHVHDGGSTFTITPSLYIEANMKGQVIHAKKFGVVGDFDPSTGVGTDDRVSLQSAFDYAISVAVGRRAKTVKLPQDSNIYLNGYSDLSAEAVILRYGRVDTRHKNVHIDGNGCSIFPGREGRCLAIVNVESCLVKALKVYGYTGGSIGAWRENDAGIAVVYGSSDVTLDSIYVTNVLGDQVLIGGSLSEAGGGQGWTAKDVTIKNSTLKERYGNGVRSYSGGTRSRLCVAVIDGRDITIRNNTIIGGVDIEPNLSGQKSINIDVNSNKFQSGYVTPQSVIGTDFWHDEPKGIVGGTVIEQSIVITGIPATPTVSGCRANNNSIESGYISTYADYRFDQIHSNNFQEGSIFVGDTSGANYNVDFNVSYNQCLRKLTRENSFIVIKGNVLFSSFTANESIDCPCIGVDGGLDGGRNTFLLNKVKRGSSVVLGFDLNPTSVEFGSTTTDGMFGKPTSVNSIAEASAVINRLASYTLPNSFNGAVDLGLIKSNVILLNQGDGDVTTITGFTGQIGDGHCIKVQFTASGGGACTLIHSPAFALKGSINVAPSLNSVMEFMFRTGVWFEISRSF